MTLDSDCRSLTPHRCTLVLALLVTLCAGSASAQTEDVEARAIARDFAMQGAEAFENQEYDLALDRFDRAAALIEAPSIGLMQARTLVALGRWVEGLDKYHQTALAQLAPDAPAAFQLALVDATREAAELDARMPHLEIRVGSGQDVPDGMTINLDGKLVPAVLLNVPRPIDPGEHEVVAVDANGRSTAEHVTVLEGEHKLVSVPVFEEVVVEAPVEPPPPPLPANPMPTPEQPPPASQGQLRDWASPVAFAVGGLGVAGAALSGLAARDKQQQLDAMCDPGCPSSASETLSSYRTQRTLFYVSMGVGLAGLGAGTYLSLMADDDTEPGVSVLLSPFGGSVLGRF